MGAIIGITGNYREETNEYSVRREYVEAIETAGGFPVFLTPTSEIPTFLDGIVMSGGGDIDPAYYHEEPIPQCGKITPIRDRYELILAQFALESYIPILGICRGMQVLNVAGGGTLHQDLYTSTSSQIMHEQKAPSDYPIHNVRLEQGSLLKDIYKRDEFRVNSFHHQSVKSTGTGFKVTADCADGTIEGIEHSDHVFAVGVQWHPEYLKDNDVLFKYFVDKVKSVKK